LTQQRFCEGLVPAGFSDAHGDACIKAVAAAYADADLTGTELTTVLQLGAPCDAVIKGPKGQGEVCARNSDCDESAGFACVLRGGDSTGTCQVPELVGPGQKCGALQQLCMSGFFCDGKNCIASKDAGEDCVNDGECAPSGYCSADSKCVTLLGVGLACDADEQCQSELCYASTASMSCADRVRLSPAEPICQNLR
jgi:hypothetical protein